MFRHLILVILLSMALISCNGGTGAFVYYDGATDNTGNGNIPDNQTTDFSNITLKSHIPTTIPDGAGGTLTTVFWSFDMGNDDSSITYILEGSDVMHRVYKPTVNGPVEIYSRPAPAVINTNTSGDGNKLISYNGVRDIIDYDTGDTLAIGTTLGPVFTDQISYAGDIVAFNSNFDLTGDNPADVNQLFTLSTDGSEMYNQITTFTTNHIIGGVVVSGDGTKIFFSSTSDITGDGSNSDGSLEIFSINTDGSGLAQLTSFDSVINTTSASEDGNVITMEIDNLDSVTGTHVYTLNITTSAFTEITVFGNQDTIDYDLSSDGSKLAYIRENEINSKVIYLVNTDGTSETSALVHAGVIAGVQLNSNGTQITFHSNIDFGKDVAEDDLPIQIYTLTVN